MCVRIQGKNSCCSQLDIVSVSYIHFLKFMANYSETSLTFFTENRRQITPMNRNTNGKPKEFYCKNRSRDFSRGETPDATLVVT